MEWEEKRASEDEKKNRRDASKKEEYVIAERRTVLSATNKRTRKARISQQILVRSTSLLTSVISNNIPKNVQSRDEVS